MSRSFWLGLAAVWGAAALLLYFLQPALAATYLVASAWLGVGAAGVWALTRWPPFQRTLAQRRERRRGPQGPGSGPAR